MHADVLIVTATKVESKAVLQVFQEATKQAPKAVQIDGRTYQNLGVINGMRVLLAQSEMGTGGLGASHQTVQKGIDALTPSAVIMVGIAFGIDSQKQSIGDILVSRQLKLYELRRVGTDDEGKLKIITRGDQPHASSRLLNHFTGAELYWDDSKPRVRFGLILSGEKLVDNTDFRRHLHDLEPEAIGGEMEGAGLYVACQDCKVDWILVKAICDWADGNKAEDKNDRQKLAAHNAASFVLHVLQRASLRDSRSPKELVVHSTLPHQLNFFGREEELEKIADALSPESRSWGVLIDGPGGVGKTALAIRAGHLAPVEDFPLKIFLSAKVRELTPSGEQPLQDFMLANYMSLLSELAAELGERDLAQTPPEGRANALRHLLKEKHALIVIDNLETFEEPERIRTYQFLSRLPDTCKAIVTSRRRTDIDARVIRLDRLRLKEALDLINELAKSNRQLDKADEREWHELYELTGGNPLLIKWVVGQLGRSGIHRRTLTQACDFLKSAPKGNDPLEYVFGDLLETYAESQIAVLAALAHFTEPAKVEWVAELADLTPVIAQTVLEDLTDRALLEGDEASQTFLLPTLAATFLRSRRPEALAQTGDRLISRAYSLAMENGHAKHERFPQLEADWPTIASALPLFLLPDGHALLQNFCGALNTFLEFSGRWDEELSLNERAEEIAFGVGDFRAAGQRAFDAGWIYDLRGQGTEVLACAARCEAHWQKSGEGFDRKAQVLHLRGHGHQTEKNYPAAIEAYEEFMNLYRNRPADGEILAIGFNHLASVERSAKNYIAAEHNYREAIRISESIDDKYGVAIYTSNLSALMLEHEDWPAAQALAQEALKLSESLGAAYSIGLCCYYIAKALARQGLPQEGLPYARRAVKILSGIKSSELKEAQAVLAECEEQDGIRADLGANSR
jgi:nucleoside phosphorylase/tetratricopeptide (TPR) repeat protein